MKCKGLELTLMELHVVSFPKLKNFLVLLVILFEPFVFY
jgi:hypothetical protein